MSLVFTTTQCLTGPSNMSLPDGDWCFAVVYRVTDNSGGSWNNLFSAGTVIGAGELDMSIGEDSRASVKTCLQLRVGDGTNLRFVTAADNTAIIGPWALAVAQRSGTEKQIWQCAMGGTPVKIADTTVSLGATSHNTPLYIARRSMNQTAAHSLTGSIAYLARGSFALSSAQLAALAAGICPRHVSTSWAEYLPLFQAGPASLKAVIGGGAYAVTGSPATGGQPCALW